MCSSRVALRRWRAWILNKLLLPSWASSRGGNLGVLLAGVKALTMFLTMVVFVTMYICMFSKCLTWCVVLSYRCDFTVQFDNKTNTSVFQLLQQACFQMVTISYDNKQNVFQHQQRLVYTRLMWGEYFTAVYKSLWSYCSSLNSLNVANLSHK